MPQWGKTLLVKLDTIRRSKNRGSTFTNQTRRLSNKFIGQVEQVFTSMPKHLDWLSFLNNDLPILLDISEEVREASNQNGLNRAQTRALKKLKDVSPEEFQRVTAKVEASSKTAIQSDNKKMRPG